MRWWAERQPTATAVIAGRSALTYGRLDALACSVAAELRRLGAGPETAVGLAVSRSPDFIVGALGILKAGGYYVPVDPSYPERRQALIQADAQVSLMVAPPASAGRWEAGGLRVVELPDGTSSFTAGPQLPPSWSDTAVSPQNLAYTVYTSGSTGAPKGVAVTHANVMNLIDADPRLRIGQSDVVAQLAPTAFDASVFEIWCALGNGARVALIACDEMSIAAIERDLDACAPGWLFLTTGLFHALMRQGRHSLGKVDRIITGGDVLSPKHIGDAAAGPSREVLAAYGPTETTVFASLHRTRPDDDCVRVPLGTALAGRSMMILDSELRPVPDGTVGEIFVAGAGLTRGYLRQPRASAERFMPNPFSPVPGARMYRTGDLGLRRPDGVFEFHGRIDRQVKIRGFRVEPGEVETFLDTCEGVDSAVVTAVDTTDAEKRLVAYIVPSADSSIGVADLRAMVVDELPAHAWPSYFVLVERLPLDPNGKVDRRKLPSPWCSRDLMELPPYEPPRTTAEEAVCTILAESLGLDRVGREDDFFALGGTSLQSVLVLDRLRDIQHVTAREFFAHPTVARLAELLENKKDARLTSPAPEEALRP
ncbi:amino acid adenylation domain-containing protein [Streptomyces sp. NPDC050164]|uniref:amino acid adenylation domain-containing protein n=1 Tax=Streptomyces sp. NPDC050164 TaxID=3365605 RepID=UPI00379BC020